MSQSEQKAHEERILAALSQKAPHYFERIWIPHESPDFISQNAGTSVGLELTCYVTNGDLTGREKFLQNLARRCNELTSGRKVSFFRVTLRFNYRSRAKFAVDSKSLNTLANRLVDFVEAQPTPSEEGLQHVDAHIGPDLGKWSIVGVEIDYWKGSKLRPFWTVPQAGFIAPISGRTISERIVSKNEKRKKYSHQFNETWLVIVAGGFGPSSWADVDVPIEECQKSEFDRTWFFDALTGELVEPTLK